MGQVFIWLQHCAVQVCIKQLAFPYGMLNYKSNQWIHINTVFDCFILGVLLLGAYLPKTHILFRGSSCFLKCNPVPCLETILSLLWTDFLMGRLWSRSTRLLYIPWAEFKLQRSWYYKYIISLLSWVVTTCYTLRSTETTTDVPRCVPCLLRFQSNQ